MGFAYVASGPMVRSSYRAGEFYLTNMLRKDTKKEDRQQGTATSATASAAQPTAAFAAGSQ